METNPPFVAVELDLESQTFQGLAQVLSKVFSDPKKAPLTVLSPASTNEQREQFRETGKTQYPYASLIITNISKNHQNNYNDGLRRVGINRSNDNGTYTNYRLIPINIICTFRFTCQSLHECIKFSKRWMHGEKISQFNLRNGNLQINIQLKYADDLTIPTYQVEDTGNVFVIESTITVSTYSGEYTERPNIKKVVLQFMANSKGDTSIEFDNNDIDSEAMPFDIKAK